MTRKILDFLTSPTGKFMAFGIVVVGGCLVFNYYKSLTPADQGKAPEASFNEEVEINRSFTRHRDGFDADTPETYIDENGEEKIVPNQKKIKSKAAKEKEQAIVAAKEKDQELAKLKAELAAEKAKAVKEEVKKSLAQSPANPGNKSVPIKPFPSNQDSTQPVQATGDVVINENGKVLIINKSSTPVKREAKASPPFHVSPVSLYDAKPVKEQVDPDKLSDTYAPYGRLIKCQLVNTVDSSSLNTPVIALVTDDVWHNGKLVIPAGTEVHGVAQTATVRNRIATDTSWVAVWRTRTKDNGKELKLQGLALDYSQDINTKKFSITDGSAGLRGFEVKTDEYAELKLYAALFLKGVGEGVSDLLLEEAKDSQSNTTVVGDNNSNSNSDRQQESDDDQKNQIKVGIAKGAEEVADTYAQRMLDAISRDGVYIRVPAGTTFYLYIQQTIDKGQATAGATIGVEAHTPDIDGEERQRKENEELNTIFKNLVKQKLEASKHQQLNRESK
jgi:hypothetical protein